MRPFDWSDNERLKNWLTFSVFLGVVIFVFIQLSNVFTNSVEITYEISHLRAEERLTLSQIDLLMTKIPPRDIPSPDKSDTDDTTETEQ